MTFKVGDKIRRVSNAVCTAPIGFETVVVEPKLDAGAGRVWYVDRDGDNVHGDVNAFELISESPVRTVTRQEIIPGTYDEVEVGPEVTGRPQREVMIRIAPDHGPMVCMDHEALTRAAAVLTALAGALRDE